MTIMGDVDIIAKYMNELREKYKITIVLPEGGKPLPISNYNPFSIVDYLDLLI